jgi:hypothetical protein
VDSNDAWKALTLDAPQRQHYLTLVPPYEGPPPTASPNPNENYNKSKEHEEHMSLLELVEETMAQAMLIFCRQICAVFLRPAESGHSLNTWLWIVTDRRGFTLRLTRAMGNQNISFDNSRSQ